jgi:hypothetical protein
VTVIFLRLEARQWDFCLQFVRPRGPLEEGADLLVVVSIIHLEYLSHFSARPPQIPRVAAPQRASSESSTPVPP